jgi:site-specific recombinase XerD
VGGLGDEGSHQVSRWFVQRMQEVYGRDFTLPPQGSADGSHQLRHAHAVEMAREGVPLVVIQRQLGHSNLGITSVYLQGIDNAEIIDTVHTRRAPLIPVSTSLRL